VAVIAVAAITVGVMVYENEFNVLFRYTLLPATKLLPRMVIVEPWMAEAGAMEEITGPRIVKVTPALLVLPFRKRM